MKKTPRYYQQDAYDAILDGLKVKESVPYINACTGSGKSFIAAMLTNTGLNNGRRVLQLVPTKELCAQNYEEAFNYVDHPHLLGICCAKLSKFQISRQSVIATASSFLNRRGKAGAFDLLIIDECHCVAPKEGTTYQKIIKTLLERNPNMRIVGMTATPYRMDMGMIHERMGKYKPLFTHCCYESDIKRLIHECYLSHVENISGDLHANIEGVPMAGKDYDSTLMGVRFDEIVSHAVSDMKAKFAAYDIKTSLIFASSLDNARHILEEWNDGDTMRMVHGEMDEKERKATIDWLKQSEGQRHIVNVGILTTGFDFTALDCVVLMRSTASLGLYIQAVGRVIRAHAEKERGYLLDYGQNVDRHGAIDEVNVKAPKGAGDGEAPYRKCKKCGEHNNVRAVACQACGHIFPEPETGNYSMRSNAQVINQPLTYNIASTDWKIEIKGFGKAGITHQFYGEKGGLIHEEHLRFDNDNGAEKHAQAHILRMMKDPMIYFSTLMQMEGGVSVRNVSLLFEEYEDFFKPVSSITIAQEGKYPRMISMELENDI